MWISHRHVIGICQSIRQKTMYNLAVGTCLGVASMASVARADLVVPLPIEKKPATITISGDKAGQTDNLTNDERFMETVFNVVEMTEDGNLQQRASQYGLNIVNVMWEDTARFEDSSVGPNISDFTLQVHHRAPTGLHETFLLPVLRYPNFSDTTADVAIDKIWIKVGNQHGGKSVAVPLTEVLSYLPEYLSDPRSFIGAGLSAKGNFLAKRDTHVLVSAQHVFVPMPKEGKAEFNPVLYNYQSYEEYPAVLAMLITRHGTSITVIENRADEDDMGTQAWGQQLYFNNAGKKTLFTAERISAVKQRIESGHATKQDEGALDEGSDMMMMIQIPLKVSAMYDDEMMGLGSGSMGMGGYGDVAMGAGGYGAMGTGSGTGSINMPMIMAAPAPAAKSAEAAPVAEGVASAPVTIEKSSILLDETARRDKKASAASDLEKAVVGYSDDLGKFVEGNHRTIERDPRFPIRVTVQFYKATSNGVISEQDLHDAAAQIDKVYAQGDYVGSLVVDKRDRSRPTDWQKGRTPRTWLRKQRIVQ